MNREILRLTKRMQLGRPIESYPVTITSSAVKDRPVRFCTNLELDPVQRKHRRGVFYEMQELTALADHFPKGGTFVDIGAHSGNHSLFAALFMDAGKVIPIEPNPPAYRLLIQNMLINDVAGRVDFSKLGCAVGAAPAEGAVMKSGRRNPAAARLKAKGGDIAVCRADVLLGDETPDVIKVDVCGMEMDVLEGLAEVFARCTPTLLVEVAATHDEAFNAWAKKAGYTIAAATKRNKHDHNYMLTHKDAAKAKPKTAAKKSSIVKRATAATKATGTKAKPTAAKTSKPKTSAASKMTKTKVTTAKSTLIKAL